MSKWRIEYYEDHRGDKPIEAYIDSLPVEKQANIFRLFDLLEEFGIQLGTPYLKHIDGKIWGGFVMNRFLISLVLVTVCTVMLTPCGAQSLILHQGISETNINVRGNPVVVGELNIDIPESGNVVVHFDGFCISDAGDRIVLAASNTPDWGVNDGSVGVEAVDDDVNRSPFSHTRMYPVSSGNHTFYAVAENLVEQEGDGLASIYASLSVVFFPDLPEHPFVEHQGISETNINVRGNPVVVGELNIDIPESGNVVVHFDGVCISDAGDRILLAASDVPDWTVNDGHTSVEAADSDVNRNSFSHTRVYDVSAGSHNFYAVVEASSVEEEGNGEASIYASLTVEFFPDVSTGVLHSDEMPMDYSLHQNFPNPFNPVTTISYQLPKSAMVNLSVYNVVGQVVETLLSERKQAGFYQVEWNASRVGSGIYFYRIEAGEYTETKKCLILK